MTESQAHACRLCQGTGDCHRREGTGERLRSTWFGLKRVVKCGNCRGSGRCEMCGGLVREIGTEPQNPQRRYFLANRGPI